MEKKNKNLTAYHIFIGSPLMPLSIISSAVDAEPRNPPTITPELPGLGLWRMRKLVVPCAARRKNVMGDLVFQVPHNDLACLAQ